MLHLTPDDDQRLIVDSAERLLAQDASSAATRAAAASVSGIDATLFRQMAELGWCGVHLPAEQGGLGLGHVELALLQEQMGRRLACVPYFDSVAMAATLLSEAVAPKDDPSDGQAARWLAALASGACTAAWAWGGHAHATRRHPHWVLDGDWPQVGSAACAHLLLLPAQGPDGEPQLWAVPADTPGLQITALSSIDTTRRHAAVQARHVVLDAGQLLSQGPACTAAQQRSTALAAIALAAEQLGVAQQCLDLTVAYVQQRVQFGQAIARFQAVKHRCAQMLVAVETARSAVYGAAAWADTRPGQGTLDFHAALARSQADRAARFCSQEAIQLHGGVGFTWEYDPHLYFKRAQASSHRLGPATAWHERVAAQLLDGDSA